MIATTLLREQIQMEISVSNEKYAPKGRFHDKQTP